MRRLPFPSTTFRRSRRFLSPLALHPGLNSRAPSALNLTRMATAGLSSLRLRGCKRKARFCTNQTPLFAAPSSGLSSMAVQRPCQPVGRRRCLQRSWSLDVWKIGMMLRRSKIFIVTLTQIAASSVGAAYHGQHRRRSADSCQEMFLGSFARLAQSPTCRPTRRENPIGASPPSLAPDFNLCQLERG
jgi:hypothetical protein